MRNSVVDINTSISEADHVRYLGVTIERNLTKVSALEIYQIPEELPQNCKFEPCVSFKYSM